MLRLRRQMQAGRNTTLPPLRSEYNERSEAIFDCTGGKGKGKLPQYASLVQLVERRSPKPDVEGSSPSGRDL